MLEVSMSGQWSDGIPFDTPIECFPDVGSDGECPGVYRVVLSRLIGRLIGKSDVLYVGSAECLGARLTKKHHVLPRLRELASKLGPGEMLCLQLRTLKQADVPPELGNRTWARLLETAELNEYMAAHLELPPFNGRSEGYIAGRAMLAVSEGVVAGRVGIAGVLAPVDEEVNALTYLPLRLRKGQKRDAQLPQLLWTWPEEWWGEEVPWWRDSKAFGRANPRLEPDTLYAFVPGNSPLASRFWRRAQQYDFAEEGGLWWTLALTGTSWRSKALTSDKMDELRSAILQPIEQFRKALQE